MDRITKSYLDEFIRIFDYGDLSLTRAFELFSNYCVVSKHLTNETFSNAGQEAVCQDTYTNVAFDGLAIIMNGHLVSSKTGIDDILSSNSNVEIEIVVVETKASITSAEAVDTLCSNLVNAFSVAYEDIAIDAIAANDEDDNQISYIYSKSATLSSHGLPQLFVYFVADGIEKAIEGQIKLQLSQVSDIFKSKGIFSSIQMNLWNGKDLVREYDRSKFRKDVTVKIQNMLPFPSIKSITNGYVCFVPFSEFKKLIIDENGSIMSNVFHDNIRAFQGKNVVNQSMSETIKNGPIEEFVLMNNGITVVASDVDFTTSNGLTLKDYQIVNGCQTCHVLYNNRFVQGIDELQLMVRVIASKDSRVRNAIILGTNSQTVVRREQLMALSELQERIENYYRSITKPEQIYYERRSKQYLSETSIPQYKVITIPIQIMTFVSMFIGEPQNVTGYYSQIIDNLERNNKKVFSEQYAISTYYTSGLAYYKLSRLLKSGAISHEYANVKYHLLYAFRLVAGDEFGSMPALDKPMMEEYCDCLNKILWDDVRCLAYFKKGTLILDAALGRKPVRSDRMSKTFTQRIGETSEVMLSIVNKDATSPNDEEDFKALLTRKIQSATPEYLFTNGTRRAILTLIELIRHSAKTICFLTGKMYEDELNDNSVINALSRYLEAGGSLRILMYNYTKGNIINTPVFRRLAILKEDGRDIEIRVMSSAPLTKYAGQTMQYNMYLFDQKSERFEAQEDFRKGRVWVNDPDRVKPYQASFDSLWKQEANLMVDLLTIFKLV